MTTIYTADRNADYRRNRTDEDRSMAYELIYKGEDLEQAREDLKTYMQREVDYLRDSAVRYPHIGRRGLDTRADDIENRIVEVGQLDPENGRQAEIKVAGLVFAIFRRDI